MSNPERRLMHSEIESRHLDVFDRIFLEFFQNDQLFEEQRQHIQIDSLFAFETDEQKRSAYIAKAREVLPGYGVEYFTRWLLVLPLNEPEQKRIWERLDRYQLFHEDEVIDWERIRRAHFGVQHYEPYNRIYSGLQRAFVEQWAETMVMFSFPKTQSQHAS